MDTGRRARGQTKTCSEQERSEVIVAIGHVPVFGSSRFLQEWQDMRL